MERHSSDWKRIRLHYLPDSLRLQSRSRPNLSFVVSKSIVKMRHDRSEGGGLRPCLDIRADGLDVTDLLHSQIGKIGALVDALLSPGSIMSLPAVATSLVIAVAWLAWRQRVRRGRLRPAVLFRAAAGRRILLSPSTRADVYYYFVNTLAIGGLIGWGLLSAVSVAEAVAGILGRALGGPLVVAPVWVARAVATLATFLAYEIAYYLAHYMLHRVPVLWAVHKTHHSAEVLTPLTIYRVHPLESLFFINIVAVFSGTAYALSAEMTGHAAGVLEIGGTNAILTIFYFTFAQLQHSQFWIPLTGLAGKVLLSPAHHQIHHSVDPAHYNTNLGSLLAVWDWMFGTLHVPSREPARLRFGVLDGNAEPHRIHSLLVTPVVEALDAARKTVAPAPQPAAPAEAD
jgi:sterol desaturase/sphingolipid hydroxylase (fatty acid hydroxylase superfamily)